MKKLYNNTLMQLILALCTFSFVACQEFDIDSQPEGPLNIQIDALESYTALATSPSNVVFNISSNTPWTIESDQQWCKPTPSMSAASSLVSEIVVTMENNTGKKARTAKLTIKAEGVEGTKVVTIEQASKEDLVVVPYDELVPTEGGSITFTIASNKAWEIIPSTAFLSNIDKTSGTGNEDAIAETVTVTLPANAGAKRAGTLTVKTEFEEYTFTITQNGVIIELEEDPESTTISMPGTGSGMEKTVLIRANKEWKVEVPKEYQSWLKAEALSETELKVTTTTTNNLMVNRVGHIIMKTKEVIDGFDGITFDISQGTAFWKEGGADNYVVDEETGYMTLYDSGIVTNYLFKKGRLAFDFESINLTGEDWIEFNMWPNSGNTNFHLHFYANKESNFTCGGSGLNWTQKTFTWTSEQTNVVKKIEFLVVNKEEGSNALVLKLIIDGVEVAVLDNNITDPYATEPGAPVYFRMHTTNKASNFTVKSITWEPVE